MVKVCDKIGKLDDPCVFELIDKNIEALALLGQSNYQINMLRIELMKSNMKGEYPHLLLTTSEIHIISLLGRCPQNSKRNRRLYRISNKLNNLQHRSDRSFAGRNRFDFTRGRRSTFQNRSTQSQNRNYSGYNEPKNFRGRRGNSWPNINK